MNLNWWLADAAQVVAGKLFVLGGGWSYIVPGGPFAVCGKIDIPWHEATDWHTLRLELVDFDGQPFMVSVDAPDGEQQPLVVEPPPYRASILPHVKPGTPIDWPFALNVGPGMPLEPGTGYAWRASIDGKTHEDWTLPFSTLPADALPKAA